MQFTPTELNGKLYFAAEDGTNGVELWSTDGTDANTAMVKNINPANTIVLNGWEMAHKGIPPIAWITVADLSKSPPALPPFAPPVTPPPPAAPPPAGGGLSVGAIVGISVGAVFVFALVVVLGVIVYFGKPKKNAAKLTTTSPKKLSRTDITSASV